MNIDRSNKPWSESSEQNREPIQGILEKEFTCAGTVLEIGSGTGQHAAYFPAALRHLLWQPSDVGDNLPAIEAWREEAALSNVLPAFILDVDSDWPEQQFDYAFSANTAHIMSWSLVEKLFQGVASVLSESGKFCLYGPFNRNGKFTSASNERFDGWLKSRDPLSGIRDIQALKELAETAGLKKICEHEMPVNNLILVFEKS